MIAILIATPALFSVAFRTGLRILIPIVCAAPAYVAYYLLIPHSIWLAFVFLLIWTLIQSALVLFATLKDPVQSERRILNAEPYTRAMFHWIETGALPEGTTPNLILTHARQAILYCLLAVISANVLSLVLGCFLLNYMNYYVAHLMLRSDSRIRALMIGWNFWSIIRVLSFLYLGSILGTLLLSFYISVPRISMHQIWPGVIGIIIDVFFKIRYSDPWRLRIKSELQSGKR